MSTESPGFWRGFREGVGWGGFVGGGGAFVWAVSYTTPRVWWFAVGGAIAMVLGMGILIQERRHDH